MWPWLSRVQLPHGVTCDSLTVFQLDVRTFGRYFLITLNKLCFLSIKFYIILPRKSFCSSFISYLDTSLFELNFIKQCLLYQARNKVCGLYDDHIFYPFSDCDSQPAQQALGSSGRQRERARDGDTRGVRERLHGRPPKIVSTRIL